MNLINDDTSNEYIEYIKELLRVDSIKRNKNINSFLKLLNSQTNFGSIAINGNWGSGKTIFIKQCEYIINNPNERENHKYFLDKDKKIKAVYYDAWQHDNDVDPILSITKTLYQELNLKDDKEFLSTLVKVSSSIVSILYPKLTRTTCSIKKYFSQKLQKSREDFNKIIEQIVKKAGVDRLVIFIDELDRCNPIYAIKLLERIKHYFANKNINFVFGININELKFTVENYYGSNFNGYEYLDRFFDLIIQLPEPDINSYLKFMDNKYHVLKISDLLHEHSIIKKYDKTDNVFYDTCNRVIKKLGFSMRQINHFYQTINTVSYNILENELNKIHSSFIINNFELIIYFIIPVMVGIKLTSLSEYQNFINMKDKDTLMKILNVNKDNDKTDNHIIIEIANNLKKTAYQFISDLYELSFTNHHYKKLLMNSMSMLSEDNYNKIVNNQ